MRLNSSSQPVHPIPDLRGQVFTAPIVVPASPTPKYFRWVAVFRWASASSSRHRRWRSRDYRRHSAAKCSFSRPSVIVVINSLVFRLYLRAP